MKTKTRKEVQKESSIQTAKQALVNNGRKQNKNEQLESLKVLQIKKKRMVRIRISIRITINIQPSNGGKFNRLLSKRKSSQISHTILAVKCHTLIFKELND